MIDICKLREYLIHSLRKTTNSYMPMTLSCDDMKTKRQEQKNIQVCEPFNLQERLCQTLTVDTLNLAKFPKCAAPEKISFRRRVHFKQQFTSDRRAISMPFPH